MMSRDLLQVYIEDCLVDRLWTDLEPSKLLVDNINTLFHPTTAPQEQGDEGMAGGGDATSAGAQATKPHPAMPEGETTSTPAAAPLKSDLTHIPLDGVKVEQR